LLLLTCVKDAFFQRFAVESLFVQVSEFHCVVRREFGRIRFAGGA
jgi:hypothetical protein